MSKKKKSDVKIYKWSDEAVGSLMMTLQKCLLENIEIVPLLKGWDLAIHDGEIVVLNPPIFNLNDLDKHADEEEFAPENAAAPPEEEGDEVE